LTAAAHFGAAGDVKESDDPSNHLTMNANGTDHVSHRAAESVHGMDQVFTGKKECMNHFTQRRKRAANRSDMTAT